MDNNLVEFIRKNISQFDIGYSGAQHILSPIWLLSVSDGQQRAKTVQFVSSESCTREAFLAVVEQHLVGLQAKFAEPLIWAKLEYVESCEPKNLATLQLELKKYKRNYFRSGIAFLHNGEWLLLPEGELNAHACLYGGVDVAVSQLNPHNFQIYFKNRFGEDLSGSFLSSELMTFKTAGLFFDAQNQEAYPLSTVPRTHGRRALPPLSADYLANLIEKITAYLGNQVRPAEKGKYEYGYFPCFGRTIETYNTLRHASSTYALLEGYEFCQSQQASEQDLAKLREQIELALDYLTQEIIREYGDDLAYTVEINNEIKLGGNAVAILALSKYVMVFADSVRCAGYLALAEKLANGIVKMQKADGSFVHILDANTLEVLAENRIIYYDGEASFGLMRLYGITKDPRWIECVRKAFDHFVQSEHNGAHDHWLSYCSNELAIYQPDRKYFEFAVNNVKGYVNFIRNRITTFPTLLELSMAFHKMLLKLDEFPEYADVLDGFDVADFYQALHTRANYLLNGVFFPELAMHFRYPQTILYGCFIRHHSFRVRIDDVEHYLSGLIAYHQLLANPQYPQSLQQLPSQRVQSGTPMGAEGLALATGGKWLKVPEADWKADGMSIFPKRFRKGHIIVARGKHMDKGYLPPLAVKSLVAKGASAIICDDGATYADFGVPVLVVPNVKKAVLDVGTWVRKQYLGRVVGVTGSAGKTTTVAMLAHTLSAFGGVGQSLDSANLPAGIAWNLSMMDQHARHWILEMAIGSMNVNSQMVQPDLAIITNIAPAHLEYHKTVEIIAEKKARIFEGMKPQSQAIICRDIEQFEILAQRAALHHLKLTTYGEHPEADMRLVSVKAGVAKLSIFGKNYSLKMQAKGTHMLLNALAVLAVVYHQGLDIETALKKIAAFKAVSGRGEIFKTQYQGKNLTIFDEAYNANPLSMRSALTMFNELKEAKKRKIAIIGDMLELGQNSVEYHLGLVAQLHSLKVREIVLVGEMSQHIFAELVKMGNNVRHFVDVQAVKSALNEIVQDGDSVLIKASHGIGLHSLFEKNEGKA